jgi:hypothetical protein
MGILGSRTGFLPVPAMLLKGHGLDICNRREAWTGKGYESYFKALQRSGLATRVRNFEC